MVFERQEMNLAYSLLFGDWVPESMVKQLIREQTGWRDIAEKVLIVQYESGEAYQQTKPTLTDSDLLIDMDAVLNEYK